MKPGALGVRVEAPGCPRKIKAPNHLLVWSLPFKPLNTASTVYLAIDHGLVVLVSPRWAALAMLLDFHQQGGHDFRYSVRHGAFGVLDPEDDLPCSVGLTRLH